MTTKFQPLSPAVFAVIAERIEEALTASTRGQLDSLKTDLEQAFTGLLQNSPAAVADAVRGKLAIDAPESIAYQLGQVSFGQAVVAQAAERRADDNFLNTLRIPKYIKYVNALCHSDLSNVQLAGATGEQAETVSRKLRELRALGAVDFRREGRNVINFLTAASQACTNSSDVMDVSLDPAILKAMKQLDPSLQKAQNFAPSDGMDLAHA